MDIENVSSLRYAMLSGINVFVGAGFSVLALDDEDRAMPLGSQLSEELRERFSLESAAGLNLGSTDVAVGGEPRFHRGSGGQRSARLSIASAIRASGL